MSFNLRDSGGNLWTVAIEDNGVLTQTNIGAGAAPPSVYLNDPSNGTSWLLGITTLGQITQTSATLGTHPVSIGILSSPNGLGYNLVISATGVLSAVLTGNPNQIYQLSVTDAGLLQTSVVTEETPVHLVLNDSGNVTSWHISATNSGLITTTPIAFVPSYPKTAMLVSADGVTYSLSVTATGLLQTTFVPGTLSSNWTVEVGSFALIGANVYESGASGNQGLMYWNAVSFEPDQEATLEIAKLNGDTVSFIGPAVRVASGAATAYTAAVRGDGELVLQKIVAGTVTVLGTLPSGTVVAGNTVAVSAVGTTITAYLNGNVVLIATDSAIVSGQPGIFGIGASQNQNATAWSAIQIGASYGELLAYQTATLTGPYNYNLGTLLRRGVAGSEISAHGIGSDFLRLDDNVNEYDYDPQLIGKTVFFKFTSFNLRQMQEENLANVPAFPFTITGQSLGLLTPAHATYRPTSNPLTGQDAGSTATIFIASFAMRIPGISDISVNSGSIAGLAYNEIYYVYYDDPTFSGGAVVYEATETKEIALNGAGRFFVGSIQTPTAGGPDTIGNADGGAGAQVGVFNASGMTANVYTGPQGNGAVTNLNHPTDSDASVPSALTVSGDSAQNFIGVKYIAAPNVSFSQAVINLIYSLPTNNLDAVGSTPAAFIKISFDGGSTFPVEIVNFGGGGGTVPTIQTATIPVPANTAATNVIIEAFVSTDSSQTTGSVELDIYQAWLQVLK